MAEAYNNQHPHASVSTVARIHSPGATVDLAPGRLVTLAANDIDVIQYAGTGDPIGVALDRAAPGDVCNIAVLGGPVIAIAAGAIPNGSNVEASANGRLQVHGAGQCLGVIYIPQAASVENQHVELYLNPEPA